MFTGIVEEVGSVRRVLAGARAGAIAVAARTVLEGTRIGDSIAVNGVCLTVTSLEDGGFTADVMLETLAHSNLGALRPGSAVDLERAMAANGRFGGHIVTGHIDGTGVIARKTADQNAVRLTVQAAPSIMQLVMERGSIAVDGVSLTVASVEPDRFTVSVIPHTGAETVLLRKRTGQTVNLENDVVGKYVHALMGAMPDASGTPRQTAAHQRAPASLTREYLANHGF